MIIEYLEIGKIVSTHGIKGELRVQPWCDSGDFMKDFKKLYLDKNGKTEIELTACRPHGNIVIVKLDGIDDVETATKMRNKVLFMKRADAKLDENQFFIQELFGCEVFDADVPDKSYGIIEDVSETGANDVWHIKQSDGNVVLIPSIPQVVINVDVKNERVEIRPLKGIFDDEN